MFDPITLPIAISFSFLIEATADVTNSGKDVPTATIVNPIIASLIPKALAIFLALPTTIDHPPTIANNPAIAKNTFNNITNLFDLKLTFSLFFKNKWSE